MNICGWERDGGGPNARNKERAGLAVMTEKESVSKTCRGGASVVFCRGGVMMVGMCTTVVSERWAINGRRYLLPPL